MFRRDGERPSTWVETFQPLPYDQGGQHPDDDINLTEDEIDAMMAKSEPVELTDAHSTGPEYYRQDAGHATIQPWTVIDAFGLDFYLGNVVKYVLRAGKKGAKLEDLKKAQHYIAKAIELEETTP